MFLNNESSRNKHIQSIDSKYLKHRQICTNCNNSVTQKHDEMWDIFFNYLQENKQKLVVGSKIKKARLFQFGAQKKEVYLQLYFLKIFGTLCAEHNVDIDLTGFARSILSEVAYASFFVGISKRTWLTGLKAVMGSPMQIERNIQDGGIETAIQIMTIDEWNFELIYINPNYPIKYFPKCWNPMISKEFTIRSPAKN